MRLLGPVTVKLFVSSDSPDTDFAAKLVDIYPPTDDDPDGFGLTVCEGMMWMSYRDADTGPAPAMQTAAVYEMEISCFPASNLFAPGHRIRLDIASSNFPRREINRNTGDPLKPGKQIERNTVWHDASRPSLVMLPVTPVVV